jgi:aminoglycoside/choline kinase family phosphotransferase
MSDTFTNFIKRDDLAAPGEENEKLKQYNEKLLHENVTLFNERNLARKAKRELVEVIEKTLQIITDTLIYYAVFNYPEQPEIVLGEVLKAAVAKHKKE